MREPRRTAHEITTLAAGIGFVFLLVSCATLGTHDDLDPGAAKGWVMFLNDEIVAPITIAPVSAGVEGPAFRSTDRVIGAPVRIACPPGPNEFVVRHQHYQERIIVQVAEDAITYVGVQAQVTAHDFTGTATTTTYLVRSTAGIHPLPLHQDVPDPAPYLAALSDTDWATRMEAVRGLLRLRPVLDPARVEQLTAMAREDPSHAVSASARVLLKKLALPVPAPPIISWSFRENVELWSAGVSETIVTSYVPEGYLLEGKGREMFWWRTRFPPEIGAREDLDIVMECSWKNGARNMAFGMTIGGDDRSFNAFCVNAQGGAVVLSLKDGALASGPSPVPWTDAASAQIVARPVTRIEVRKRGADYSLSVNGIPAGGFSDESRLAIGRIGVYLSGAQSVVFHKIVVTAP